jgi:hypothetical protein
MVLRPTPCQDYTASFKDLNWHPYTKHMELQRFQQIRSVLHFNDNHGIQDSRDALYKVRPLLNALKMTFPTFIELGNEVALDEASFATKTKYGAHIVVYNPQKAVGKYHFRLYLLCCSTSYAVIRIRVHTKNDSDTGDIQVTEANRNEVTAADEDNDEVASQVSERNNNDDSVSVHSKEITEDNVELTKLTQLVVDMCKPLFDTGRVVNMDNYYTSPEAAVELKKKSIYERHLSKQ